MTRASVLLFDVDGTLVSCGGAGRVAMRAAFSERVGRSDVCEFNFAGLTDRLIARRGLTAAGVEPTDRAIDDFLDCYLSHLDDALERADGYRVLEGVMELLARLLVRTDLAMGLGTGNVERGARRKLAHGGLGAEFRFGGFGSDHEEREALIAAGIRRGVDALAPELREDYAVWVIGDTPRDVAAALHNDAACLGVATGPYTVEQLSAAGATAVVEDLTDPRIDRLLLEHGP